MNETLSKLRLVIWKNWLLQSRRRGKLLVDILIPLFIGAFLLFIRYEASIIENDRRTLYRPFAPDHIPRAVPRWNFTGDGWTRRKGNRSEMNVGELFQRIPSDFFDKFHNTSSLANGLRPAISMYNSSSTKETDGKWVILWSPVNKRLDEVMQMACRKMGVTGKAVKDSDTLEKSMTTPLMFPTPKNIILAGVAFPDEMGPEDELPLQMSVKIRFPAETRFKYVTERESMIPRHWLTGAIFPMFQVPGPRNSMLNEGGLPSYYEEGFLGLENAISSSFLEHQARERDSSVKYKINLSRFPYSKYTLDSLLVALQNFLPFLIVLCFLFSVNHLVAMIAVEKEKKMKDVMKIMGLSDSLRWTSWYLYSMIFFSLLITILTLSFKLPVIYGRPIFPNSDWTCIWIFFIFYTSATVTFSFVLTAIFSRANVASIVSGMAWFLIFIPYYVIQPKYVEVDTITKAISCLFLNTGMGIGIQIILMYEGTGSGIQWNNMMTPAIPDDGMTMALVLLMMLLDSVLYLCLALYIENVLPGEYGTPLPWYYPFQRSYWFGEDNERAKGSNENVEEMKGDCVLEDEPENLNKGIQIMNLTKKYAGRKREAVKNLYLNVYEGQITVLMGFNGAGKTTTLSILTGILSPTSGTALIGGFDIKANMKEARRSLGFCPQHNILFDELTVEEHIKFFAKLKGLNDEEIALETDKYIDMLNLKDKRVVLAKYLSGGMKRKLSVALALCGNTKVLLLDEPTAGMDPKARRSLWDILITEKKERSILMTTHFLDEADLLGDRVAIMSEGRLHCNGSTFFLKKNFSCGYHLVMVKKEDCNVGKVDDLLRSHVPEITKVEDVGMELSYQLPDRYSAKFEELFNAIETNADDIGISSFGISPTTLEDVFVRIASNVKNDERGRSAVYEEESFTNNEKVKICDSCKVTGKKLRFNQFSAMLYKHSKITLRSWKSYVILALIAVIGVGSAILTLHTQNELINLPERKLVFRDFPDGIVITKAGKGCTSECRKLYDEYRKSLEAENVKITDVAEDADMNEYLIEKCDENVYIYRSHIILATSFETIKDGGINITGWFNAEPYHVSPMALSYIYNSLFRSFINNESRLTFVNNPLSFEAETKVTIQGTGLDSGFQVSMFVSFCYIFLSSFYVLFPTQERQTKAKLLQFVSGVDISVFWSAAFLWNFLTSLGINSIVIAALAAFQEEGYNTAKELGYCMLTLISFFVTTLPLTFVASLVFGKPTLAFIQMSMFGGVTGIFTTILVAVFQIPMLELKDLSEKLDWVFSLFPLYSMGHSLKNINTASTILKICKPIYEESCVKSESFKHICCREEEKCPPSGCVPWTDSLMDWDLPGIGRYVSFLYVVGAAFALLLLALETGRLRFVRRWFRRNGGVSDLQVDEGKDSDVVGESFKVANIEPNVRKSHNLLVDGLSKRFGKYEAVKRLHLSVGQGECFGLLGANGAGKTTTFRMLTGDEYPSSGNAYVQGESVIHQLKKVYQRIGYCPQFDALFEDLTGREHLRLYCLLRGIPKCDVDDVSERLSRELLFTKYLDQKVREYSGGNKRKLSTAIALLGSPPLVYLDEPTAGMDPIAKRHLWNVISKIRSQGTTIILTSHSMEECEALCTRLTIMVKGEFKCLGSTQYLKNKFCQGYSLTIKVKRDDPPGGKAPVPESQQEGVPADNYTERIKKFVSDNFPGSAKREEHDELLVFAIPGGHLTWSKMFGLVESVKDELNVEDYSLGQTTLEQILLMFTKNDSTMDDDDE